MSAYNEIWTNIQKIVPSLNSSRGGILNKIAEVVGTFIDIVRLEMLRSEQIVEDGVKLARITTRAYYLKKAYYFQDGYNLEVIDPSTQELGYLSNDPSAQIIKQASIGVTQTGVFYLNVATSDANGNVAPLTQAQLNSFRDYWQNFVAMGAQSPVASPDPAILSANNLYIRYYNTANRTNIESAVYQALHDMQFFSKPDGILYVNELESYLSSIEGVRDAYFSEIQLSYNGDTEVPEDGKIILVPGYFNFDPALYNPATGRTVFEAVA